MFISNASNGVTFSCLSTTLLKFRLLIFET